MQIYLVWGQTGEYADHREWVVCAGSHEEVNGVTYSVSSTELKL